jgi:hypothetical protein
MERSEAADIIEEEVISGFKPIKQTGLKDDKKDNTDFNNLLF